MLSHRGPDNYGEWVSAEQGIALGFRRLAILDTSSTGNQPMVSNSGRYVITFNGEIYNFADLKKELDISDSELRGHSDTEVLLTAFEQWGIRETITRAVGMFAIALWDREATTLYLIRDRLGEKPLYYGVMRDNLLFGSELKALQQHPAWNGSIDRGALALYLRHNYVPAPYSIYSNIRKVMPGTIVSFAGCKIDQPHIEPYWSALEMVERCTANQFSGSDEEILNSLDERLRLTIRDEMVADVPLGAFLSGGVDSSLLVAIMQSESSSPIQTFTIGFDEEGFNEANHAKAVADHLGTDHTELYVTPETTLSVVSRMPVIYDEPFADSSQIPTFLVAQLARRHVTVSLSGEGGDELFAGYNRYFWGERLWSQLKRIPKPMRTVAGSLLRQFSPDQWDTVFKKLSKLIPDTYKVINPGHKIHKTAGIASAQTPDELYRLSMTHWPDPAAITGVPEHPTVLTTPSAWPLFENPVLRMMYFDLVTELPDDILVKVDRATMAVSLESRAPFLDHRVLEFAWRIPLHQKVRDGQGKWILRELLYRYVPQSLIDRPKMGFGVPIDTWLRGPLKEWASDLLSPDRLKREGFLAPEIINAFWKEHLSGQRNHSHALWGALMFQAWLEKHQAIH